MYILQDQPEQFQMVMGSKVQAIATLKDEHGGVAHIGVDDGCYVLCINGGVPFQNRFTIVTHWFKEAVHVLHHLPLPDGTDVDEQQQERTIKITATANVKFAPASELVNTPASPTEPRIETKD